MKKLIKRFLKNYLNFRNEILKYLGLLHADKNQIELLIEKGMKVGKNVIIHPQASIDSNFCYLIRIGDNSLISRGVRLLAHDATMFPFTGGYGRISRITIKENCILGTNAIILPGVTIGPNVLVGSGSVVNKDIPPNTCVMGVPAKYYSSFDGYIKKHKEKIKKSYIVDEREVFLNKNGIDEDLKRKIIEETKNGDVYMCNGDEVARLRGDYV